MKLILAIYTSVSKPIKHSNVHILPQTPQLIALLTYNPRSCIFPPTIHSCDAHTRPPWPS